MEINTKTLGPYLEVSSPGKAWSRDRLLALLTKGGSFPAFSAAVQRLLSMAQDDDVGLGQLANVIGKEPGLAVNCLRVAAGSRYGLGAVRSVEDAATRLGAREIQRIASSLGVMDRFNHLRVSVDWSRFWLHSLLVARLCERVGAAFRQATGTEYLAGLLHDSGKLMIEHHFPREFETILNRAWSARCGHYLAEREVLGLDHAQVGAAICHCLHVHPQVRTAVWHHHDPAGLQGQRAPDINVFLAAVVGFADALAHMATDGLGGERIITTPYEEWPEWALLMQFTPVHGMELDTERELAEAEADLKLFGG